MTPKISPRHSAAGKKAAFRLKKENPNPSWSFPHPNSTKGRIGRGDKAQHKSIVEAHARYIRDHSEKVRQLKRIARWP